MKKRLLTLLLALTMVLLEVVALTSCDEPLTPPTPTKLSTPVVSLNGNIASWQADTNATKFEISINGSLSYIENSVKSTVLTNGQTFKIRAIGDGVDYSTSEWSNSVTYTKTVQKLNSPVVTLNGNVASWQADANATKFEISINETPSFVESSITSQTLTNGQTFKVRAVGDGENYTTSDWSNSVTYTKTAQKLNAPVVTLNGNVASWQADANATKFEISINETPSFVESSITSQTLTNGQTFKIRAVGDGEGYSTSDWSNSVTYTKTPEKLSAPVVTLNGNVASWQADSQALRFEFSLNGDLWYTANTSTYRNLENGQTFKIRAIGDGVDYATSEWSNSVTYIEPTKLQTPTVTISSTGLASWSTVENASSYTYVINYGTEINTTSTSVQLSDGQCIKVKAIGDGIYYFDSNYSIYQTYTSPDLPPSFYGYIEPSFKNKKFTVLTKEDRLGTQAFNIVDLVETTDEFADSSINSAVAIRNATIQDLLGVKVERTAVSNLYQQINIALNSIDTTYGAIMDSVSSSLSRATSTGKFVNFNSDVVYINLEASWWDSSAIENLLIHGGAYIALGDINTVDDDATWCVLFNKQLYESYTGTKSSALYQIVKDGQWTVERLRSIASSNYTKDNNEKNKWLPNYSGRGTYGLYAQTECATVFLQAGGMTPTKSSEGFPVDNINGNSDFFTAIDTVYNLMGGTTSSEWYVDISTDVDNTYGDKLETVARGGFKSNRTLFFMCHVGTINLIRDMTADFGILPIPKLNVNQEEYGNTIQYGNALCYSVHSRYAVDKNADELSAYVLEAMAYYSSPEYFKAKDMADNSLKHAYRETLLNTKARRDDESAEMLDYVFNNRVFDIACALDLCNVNSHIQTECAKDQPHSFFGTYQSYIESKLTYKLQNLKY